MHVILIGKGGQLGQALWHRAQSLGSKLRVEGWTRPEYAIDSPGITERIAQSKPDLVINAAAWTQVDAAEQEPDAVYAVNALGPKYIAEGCAACGAAMVQISTNEVFPGDDGRMYREYDLPRAEGVYARSKLAGEAAARCMLDRLYIVRVAWLYGRGSNDFPSKILAAADGRDHLRIVADEYGNPTYAPHAAQAILDLAQTGRYGIYHLVNEGKASRFEWAGVLFEMLNHAIRLEPISGSEWPRAVTPPRHAVLVNQAAAALGLRLPPWQDGLAEYVRSRALAEGVSRRQD